MLRNWISYLILLTLSGILYVFYVGYTSWLLFYVMLSVPLISLLMLLISAPLLRMQLHCEPQMERTSTDGIQLSYRVKGGLVISEVTFQFHFQNHFTNETEESSITLMASGKKQTEALPIPKDHIGFCTMQIQKVKCYDLLGLFCIKRRLHPTCTTTLIPDAEDHEMLSYVADPILDEEGTQYSYQQGMDDSFEVRAYEKGDCLHHIHWKLSAKMDEWMVRQFAQQKQRQTALYFETCGTLSDVEATYCYVYQLSNALLNKDILHELTPLHQGEIMTRKTISSKGNLNAFLIESLRHHPDPLHGTGSMTSSAFAHGFVINAQGVSALSGGEQDA